MSPGGQSDEAGPGDLGALILDYHPAASAEMIAAARVYEERVTGLGHRFLDAVDAALATLRRSPRLGRSDRRGRRRWLVRRFPYVIIYRVKGNFLHVLAVAHTSRMPGYWKSRDSAKP